MNKDNNINNNKTCASFFSTTIMIIHYGLLVEKVVIEGMQS